MIPRSCSWSGPLAVGQRALFLFNALLELSATSKELANKQTGAGGLT